MKKIVVMLALGISVEMLNGIGGEYKEGFVTGVFHGVPGNCPSTMSGEVLRAMFDTAVRRGDVKKDDKDVVAVLSKLMREAGCK